MLDPPLFYDLVLGLSVLIARAPDYPASVLGVIATAGVWFCLDRLLVVVLFCIWNVHQVQHQCDISLSRVVLRMTMVSPL